MRTDCLVIGAGHAGLAMSRRLADRSIDHVVLERGEVANSWRTERWDSLRLLTPNWQATLPGLSYDADDPDGFMTMPEVIEFISGYADAISAPVQANTTVERISFSGEGYEVSTNQGDWTAPSVVLASGACNIASVPAVADAMPDTITSITPMTYKSPGQLPEGGVLVVGASATGVQMAEEIHRSGRPVTVAVGEHVRMPRRYRGRDVFYWMEESGLLSETYTEVDDITRARHVPSPQLVGTPGKSTLDLNVLTDLGVKLIGRLAAFNDGVAQFSGSLLNNCALADLKMGRLLNTFDEWADEAGINEDVEAPHRFESTRVDEVPRLSIDLGSGEIRTILWATGYRPDYSWLDVPVFNRKGRVNHDGGVVLDAPGMYILGMNFLRRRGSSFIRGAKQDTEDLSAHLHQALDRATSTP